MTDVHEAVLSSHPIGPPLHSGALHLHGTTTITAHQMMVMSDAAAAIHSFTVHAAQHVDLS
jgi:hypothetical protein